MHTSACLDGWSLRLCFFLVFPKVSIILKLKLSTCQFWCSFAGFLKLSFPGHRYRHIILDFISQRRVDNLPMLTPQQAKQEDPYRANLHLPIRVLRSLRSDVFARVFLWKSQYYCFNQWISLVPFPRVSTEWFWIKRWKQLTCMIL